MIRKVNKKGRVTWHIEEIHFEQYGQVGPGHHTLSLDEFGTVLVGRSVGTSRFRRFYIHNGNRRWFREHPDASWERPY